MKWITVCLGVLVLACPFVASAQQSYVPPTPGYAPTQQTFQPPQTYGPTPAHFQVTPHGFYGDPSKPTTARQQPTNAPAPAQAGAAAPNTMYDYSYHGPVNYYGVPIFKPLKSQRAQRSQNSAGQQFPQQGGLFQRSYNGLGNLGSYLWSYAPAPLRGAQDPLQVPPGSGQLSIVTVPGTQ